MVPQTIPEFRLPENTEQTAFLERRSADDTCLEQRFHSFDRHRDSADPHPDDHPSATPGAYRYDPENYDPSIPESDPRSPRYEPPHLRHQPGDTWIIDTHRPYDPDDPGAHGSPDWRQDTRTGRHRRGELPDPHPNGNETIRPTEPKPGPSRNRRWQRSARESTQPRLPYLAFEAETRERPSPFPRKTSPIEQGAAEEPQQFSGLREGAWNRFLSGSQVLHEAHYTESEAFRERLITLLRNALDFILRLLGIGRREIEPDQVLAPPVPEGGQTWAMSGRPEQLRPTATAPYIEQWERQFDTVTYLRKAVVA